MKFREESLNSLLLQGGKEGTPLEGQDPGKSFPFLCQHRDTKAAWRGLSTPVFGAKMKMVVK